MTELKTIPDIEKLLSQKEYYQLRYDKDRYSQSTRLPVDDNNLILSAHQLFVNYFLHPNTDNKRLICKHSTGSGKTMTALSVATQFIKHDKFKDIKRKIIIIGYTRSLFIKELLNNPSFDIVTREMRDRFYFIARQHPIPVELIPEFNRIKYYINGKISEHFVFYGYKELYQKFFIKKTDDISNIWDISIPNYTKLYTGLENKSIVINESMLNIFKNSLVICDEVHNIYNSKELNNYGLTLQFIFNLIDYPEKFRNIISLRTRSDIWVLVLSATLINTSPTEIVDLINIIVPLRQLPDESYVTKQHFFSQDTMALLPNALPLIQSLLFGYVSYYVDANSNYPTAYYVGDEIPGIDYLKFDRCMMSKLHESTYKTANLELVGINDIGILDGVIPSLSDDKIGIYQNKKIISAITKNPIEYREQYGIGLTANNETLTGEFLKYDTIGLYSSKYKQLLNLIFNNLKNNGGKMLIIHQFVKYWGVLFIKELLLRNGMIQHSGFATDDTLCSYCGKTNISHTDKSDHLFEPVRFIMVHGNIEKSKIDDLIQLYRTDNVRGYRYRIMLGSQILNQSYDFDHIRELIIVSPYTSYSDGVQVRGRAVRHRSHYKLPPDERTVIIRHLVSSLPSAMSLEEQKYKEKSIVYRVIQDIDKCINEIAIDNYLFYDTMISRTDAFIAKKYNRMELSLKYSDKYFDAHYNINELQLVIYIIQQLFIHFSSIWHLDDLWNAIMHPPFVITVDTSLINRANYTIAINMLCGKGLSIFNTNHLIVKNGRTYYLENINKYLFMVQLYSMHKTNKRLEYKDTFMPHLLDLDPWNVHDAQKLYKSYKIDNLIQMTSVKNIDTEKQFFEEYEDKHVNVIPYTFEKYSISFHLYFIEKLILYFIDFYIIRKGTILDVKLHNFYLKCLFFYDNLELILFADQCRDNNDISRIYQPFIYRDDAVETKYKHIMEHNPFLFSSIRRRNDSVYWRVSDMTSIYRNGKVLDMVLPIGHFLSNDYVRSLSPSIYDYNEKSWMVVYNFTYTSYPTYEIENPIIVGYYYVNNTSLDYKFKIRKPITDKNISDARFIERGALCSTKNKEYLLSLIKELNINIEGKKNKNLCNEIKDELIKRELEEINKWYVLSEDDKIKSKKIKWIYFPYEQLPIMS